MNYLLYGLEEYLINEEIKKIITKNKIDEVSLSRYNLDSDSLKKVIEDCETISLFAPVKAIIVNNCNYFNRVKNNEDDVDLLTNYLNNANPNTILIIISHNETIDNTKKITKQMKKVGEIVECNKANMTTLATKFFTGYKISSSDISFLISRTSNNMDILSQEINKLKLYKLNEKEITHEDIIACTNQNIDIDIYKFVDDIASKRKDVALKTYYELVKINGQPVQIIALLASKFRLMYQALALNKKGLNNNEISKILDVHPYRVKLALDVSTRYSEKTLLYFLKALANLDSDIKTGKINAELGLELFILNL